MKVVVVGCGRVGAEVARQANAMGHQVIVIDQDRTAFQRLGEDFGGRTVEGHVLDQAALTRAEIEEADGFAAVTPSDETNLVAARIARDLFHIPNVVARVYDPDHLTVFANAGLQTVISSTWGARRMLQLLTYPGVTEVARVGNGEIVLLEARLPEWMIGQPVSRLSDEDFCQVTVLIRGGTAMLAEADTQMQAGDLLIVATPTDCLPDLQRLLAGGAD
jgi:trk system potassium uptake protein